MFDMTDDFLTLSLYWTYCNTAHVFFIQQFCSFGHQLSILHSYLATMP